MREETGRIKTEGGQTQEDKSMKKGKTEGQKRVRGQKPGDRSVKIREGRDEGIKGRWRTIARCED